MHIDIPESEFWFKSTFYAEVPTEAIKIAHHQKIDIKTIVEKDLASRIRRSSYIPSQWDGLRGPSVPPNTFSISDVTISYNETLICHYNSWQMAYTITWPMNDTERDIYTEATRKRLERSAKAKAASQKAAESRKVKDREKILADIKKKAKRDPLLASALAEVISGGSQ